MRTKQPMATTDHSGSATVEMRVSSLNMDGRVDVRPLAVAYYFFGYFESHGFSIVPQRTFAKPSSIARTSGSSPL